MESSKVDTGQGWGRPGRPPCRRGVYPGLQRQCDYHRVSVGAAVNVIWCLLSLPSVDSYAFPFHSSRNSPLWSQWGRRQQVWTGHNMGCKFSGKQFFFREWLLCSHTLLNRWMSLAAAASALDVYVLGISPWRELCTCASPLPLSPVPVLNGHQ